MVGISFISNDPGFFPAQMLSAAGPQLCGILKDATGYAWPAFSSGTTSDHDVPIETSCVFEVVPGLDRFTWYPNGYPGISIDF